MTPVSHIFKGSLLTKLLVFSLYVSLALASDTCQLVCEFLQVAAVAATHDQLAERIACVEGERHLASSLCQTFHSRLSALQQTNEGLALEVTHLEQSLKQVRHAAFLYLVLCPASAHRWMHTHQLGVSAKAWHTGSPFAALNGKVTWCCIWVRPQTVLACNLVLQGVLLIDARSHALTSDNGKSHGRGVASTTERNIVALPASQPISRCVSLTWLIDKSPVVQGSGLVLPWHA